MPQNTAFTMPTDYAQEQGEIARRRKYGELLQAQSMQPLESQTAGGWVVPTSHTQGLTKLAQALMGGMAMNQAGEREKALAKQLQGNRTSTIERATKAMQGTPESWTGDGLNELYTPAQAGDPRAAASILAGSNDPTLQGVGMAQLFKPKEIVAGKPGDVLYDKGSGAINSTLPTAPKPPAWQRVELPTPTGGKRVGVMDMNAPNPLDTFKEGGSENPAMSVAPSGQAYNPRDMQPGAVMPDPNKPFAPSQTPGGAPVPNVPFQTYEKDKVTAGRPLTQTQVNVPPASKVFENEDKLRGDYEKATKTFVGIRDAFNTVNATLSGEITAPATLAAATKFMKMLDPDSVVRESELNMALKSTGMLDRFMNLHNVILKGQVLTPTQVKEIQRIASELYTTAEAQQGKTDQYFSGLAKDYGLSPDRVIRRNQGAVTQTRRAGDARPDGLSNAEFEELQRLRAQVGDRRTP